MSDDNGMVLRGGQVVKPYEPTGTETRKAIINCALADVAVFAPGANVVEVAEWVDGYLQKWAHRRSLRYDAEEMGMYELKLHIDGYLLRAFPGGSVALEDLVRREVQPAVDALVQRILSDRRHGNAAFRGLARGEVDDGR